MNSHSTELLKYLPTDITNLITQYSGPPDEWVRYWKNQTMQQITSNSRIGMPETVFFINDMYLTKLAHNVMNTHISLLQELSDFESITATNFNLLLRIIKDNIKRNMSEIQLPGSKKMAIFWIPN